jgi:wobble nucleotide-excising tRNase
LKIIELEQKYAKLKGRKEDLEASIKENEAELKLLQQEQEQIAKCNKILSFLAENNQEKIVKFFEHTLSSGLKDVFDESYSFRFGLKTRGDSSSAHFEIQNKSCPIWNNILMCNGKSVKEIIAIIFRFILVKLDKKSRKMIILDEPGLGIENERQLVLSKFLVEICSKFDIQLIVITHNENLCEYADKRLDLNAQKRSRIQLGDKD